MFMESVAGSPWRAQADLTLSPPNPRQTRDEVGNRALPDRHRHELQGHDPVNTPCVPRATTLFLSSLDYKP
ncbi:hypothetical protein [Cereibacter sphaeroides]|uniref:hypothetical protein n=1 Tax=Cereibacter sphaeroides TaxID=1063 RepID=UPI001F3647C5|nr:hypothetical protein [Cereibacter sphaeroides]MCE6967107.1 hypothetical protein [Cereibacter sphaeroides]